MSVLGAVEEVVVDRFVGARAHWTMGRVTSIDAMQMLIEGDVSGLELDIEAGRALW